MNHRVIQTIRKAKGFDVDKNRAYAKLINSQFGGNPEKGAGELCQNSIDAYPPEVPLDKRKISIFRDGNNLSIGDWGTGFNRQKIKCILTLGGTDKAFDSTTTIGRFGIGFFSIFNEELGAKTVRVRTLCEGEIVEILYIVNQKDPQKLPKIEARVLDDMKLDYSTLIMVEFRSRHTVDLCAKEMENKLKTFPCIAEVDGFPLRSNIWTEAKNRGYTFFEEGNSVGFYDATGNGRFGYVTVLARYEKIIDLYMHSLLTGGRDMKSEVEDYDSNSMPYMGEFPLTVNNNTLNVTISRDSFMLDYHYNSMVSELRNVLYEVLYGKLKSSELGSYHKLANILILRSNIRAHLSGDYSSSDKIGKEERIKRYCYKALAEAELFGISGSVKNYSLADIWKKWKESKHEYPLFYSLRRANLRWEGGAFKHDFIVYLKQTGSRTSDIDFVGKALNGIFKDVVNLETIQGNARAIELLVDRDIVTRAALSPKCDMIEHRTLDLDEDRFKRELDALLQEPEIKECISHHLYLETDQLESVFFSVNGGTMEVATGIFDERGQAFDMTNLSGSSDSEKVDVPNGGKKYIGLSRDNPVINGLIFSRNPYRVYFAMTYILGQLVNCQKLLVPYSPFRGWVKDRMSREMRHILMDRLLERKAA